jgi:hypothetical protein
MVVAITRVCIRGGAFAEHAGGDNRRGEAVIWTASSP